MLVQSNHALPISNGCSKPPGLSVDGEENFTFCCDRHDACYQSCGISKEYCEEDFGKCMTSICASTYASNKACPNAAYMFKLGTSMFGGDAFETSQDEYCKCVSKTDVDISEHYSRILTAIYNENSDKNDEEIEQTVAKAVSTATAGNKSISKLASLFYKVLKKYDGAIRHSIDGGRKGMKDVPRPTAVAAGGGKKKKKKPGGGAAAGSSFTDPASKVFRREERKKGGGGGGAAADADGKAKKAKRQQQQPNQHANAQEL